MASHKPLSSLNSTRSPDRASPTPSFGSPRREQILTTAAGLFAARGFRAVSIEDLGSAAGVTGPALYRHFQSKQQILGYLLIGVSDRLLDGAREVMARPLPHDETLSRLVGAHLDFSVEEPELIRIHSRELTNLTESDEQRVRALQRSYVQTWADQLVREFPEASRTEALLRVHATFGLLNSTPHLDRTNRRDLKDLLHRMAMASLLAD